MLLNFSVKNYLSIREEVNLSMLASSLKENFEIPKTAFIQLNADFKVLPVAVIYGANASGKSNLLNAIEFVKTFAITSWSRGNVQDTINIVPFLSSVATRDKPSEFEVIFAAKDLIFRYGFSADNTKIHEEWLFIKELKPRSKEKELFFRDLNGLVFHPSLFKVGKIIKEQNIAKENVLILTLADQLNDENAKKAISWFTNLNVLKGHQDEDYRDFSNSQILKQTSIASAIEELVIFADNSIQNLHSRISYNDIPQVTTSRKIYNESDEPVAQYDSVFNSQESEGTKKLFNLSGPIFNSLQNAKVLVIDEMDAKLHPNLLEKIVLLFQDKSINVKNAQLIFSTHNTNLLNSRLFRRDQIWITEKSKLNATDLYSIADYKTDAGKARNTEALEQNYIEGKYGGVPFLGEFENFLEDYKHEQGAA